VSEVVHQRVFWQKLVDDQFDRFAYGRITQDQFLNRMEQLGWNKKDLKQILEDEDAN
jgi:hypothetical protein